MDQQTTESRPATTMTMVLRECGICQSSIYPNEETTTCKSCNLIFHTECWTENLGCAAYGCEQVDALKPKAPEVAVEQLPQPVEQPIEALPWAFLLLGAAALSLAVSSLTYGIPSALTGLVIAYRIWKRKFARDPILLIAAIIAMIGMTAGIIVSRFWWVREAW